MASGHSERIDVRGLIYILTTLLGWSSVLLFLRELHQYIDAWTANGWRYGMCAAVFFPYQLWLTSKGRATAGVWRKAIVPSLFNSLGQICFGFSIYYIQPGLAGFLLRVSLLTSTAGAFYLFSDERALTKSRLFWIGIGCVVLGSLGTVLLSDAPVEGGRAVGILLGAGAGAFFGLYGVSVRACMQGVSSMQSFSAICSLTAAAMIACMVMFGKNAGGDVLSLSSINVFHLIASAGIGIALGHLFYFASIKRLGVAIASAVVQIAPFITGAFSTMLFAERLTPWQWGSGVVMLVGGYALLRAEQEKNRLRSTAVTKASFPTIVEDAGDPVVVAAAQVRRESN